MENVFTNKKLALAWETINEVSGRNNSNKAKRKTTSEKERIQLWPDDIKELLGKSIHISTYNKRNEQSIKTSRYR